MIIQIATVPSFLLTMTPGMVIVLIKLAITHYDGVCREAAQLGGFIYGWNNRADFAQDAIQVSATWRELDTCLKIMEHAHGLNDEQLELRTDMVRSFNRSMDRWEHDPRNCTR